jgi:hypothetical protein
MTEATEVAPIHAECGNSPHPCFPCKMRLWRQEGTFSLKVPSDWKGPSVQVRAKEWVKQAQENGYEPEYAGRAVLR